MKESYPDKVLDKLVEVITEHRKAKGLSHEKLAGLSGVTRIAISHLENRNRRPSLMLCLKLAMGLRIELSELLSIAEKAVK